ncbi:MAG: aminoglycoside phosphotransferase family protein [Candidatus Woesearchaeota archaeon]
MNYEKFNKIIEKKVIDVTKLKSGINNPTYKIKTENSKYIVQFAGDKFPDKITRQPKIVDLLRKKTSLPIYDIIKSDTTHKNLNRDYIILEYLSGKLIKNAQFDKNKVINLYKDIAKYLSSLHSINYNSFGEIKFENKIQIKPSYDTARELIYNEYISWIKKAKETVFEDKIEYLINWLNKNISVFGDDIKPSLTHNDFSDSNILVSENGKITGILDLDNISIGNNVTDIYRIHNYFEGELKEIGLKTFYENYSIDLPNNYKKQIKFYQKTHVLAYIDCWKQIKESYSKKQLKEMIKNMNKEIDELLKTKVI